MKKLVVLNGPAGCGKDTLADILVTSGFFDEKLSFKSPIFDVARGVLSKDDFDKFIKNYDDRSFKESHQSFLGGKTPREFMIWISEVVMKPVFGNDVFGKRLYSKIVDGFYVSSDGGFASEIEPLLSNGVDVMIVRLHRDGFDFSGDSRSYLYNTGAIEVDLKLDSGDIDGSLNKLIEVVNSTFC